MPKFEFTESDAKKKTTHPSRGEVVDTIEKDDVKRVNFFLPKSLYRRLRLHSAAEETTMTQVVIDSLERFLDDA